MARKVKAAGKAEVEVKAFKEGYIMTALTIPLRFKKLKDEWIRDLVLGIDWGPSSDNRMTFEEAKKYCADLGGRLPARFESITIIDDSKRNPAVLPIFRDTKTDDYYWTGTSLAGNEDVAWIVNFGSGLVSTDYKLSGNYVRPVRSSQ